MQSLNSAPTETRGYAPVNGLEMYYEIEGSGDPLVYLPPVFSCAGVKSFPALAQNHSVITVDFQGHGRTADIPERPITLEQNAKDVVRLLQCLGISKADFFGESYGGVVATMLALRYPELVGRVATYGANFGAPRLHTIRRCCALTTRPRRTPSASSFRKTPTGR